MRRGRAALPTDGDDPGAAGVVDTRPDLSLVKGPLAGGVEARVDPTVEPARPTDRGRRPNPPGSTAPIFEHLGPMLVILRWSTVGVGLLLMISTRDLRDLGNLAAALLLVAYTTVRTLRPLRLDRDDRPAELALFVELAVCMAALSLSGIWTSPFVLTPIPAVMLAGYGWGYRQGLAAAAITAGSLTLADVLTSQNGDGSSTGVQVIVVLALSGCIGAFTRQLFLDEAERRRRDLDQYARMATANDLLSALHEVVQTLPASLDLGEVVASTQRRFRELFDYTSAVLLVLDETTANWRVDLAEGVRLRASLTREELPRLAAAALDHPSPQIHADLLRDRRAGFAPSARSMLVAPLRARNVVIGLVAIEHTEPHRFGPRDAGVLDEMTGPLALAIDNATWFARLRTLGAEAERARIARDLHDRLAQSLAYVAFELERLSRSHEGDRDLEALQEVVRGVVGELRETLYQLRADVSDSIELEQVARTYLERFQERTGITCTLTTRVRGRRLPIQIEQELWRILQEALTNVERHADATRVWVTWMIAGGRAWLEVRDDGQGFRPVGVAPERFGLVGMRERAAAVGARLTLDSEPGCGTRILTELEVPR